MIKLIDAFWKSHRVVFAREREEFVPEYFIVEIEFSTALKGGEKYVMACKGTEVDRLLHQMLGASAKGSTVALLQACRKKPVLLVTTLEGHSVQVKSVLTR